MNGRTAAMKLDNVLTVILMPNLKRTKKPYVTLNAVLCDCSYS